jgi:hypothetical protein
MRIGYKRIQFEYDGQEAWVDIKRPTVGYLLAFAGKVQGVTDPLKAMPELYGFLDLTIIGWNFEDAEGRELKVEPKTIRALPIDLVMLLIRKVQEACTEIPLASRKPSTEPSS